MKNSQSLGKFSLNFKILALVAVGISMFIAIFSAHTSSALTNISPNPEDMLSIGAFSPYPNGGAADLVLKREPSSTINNIRMAAYYPSPGANTIRVYWSDNKRCETHKRNNQGNSFHYATVSLTAANLRTAQQVRSVYRIPYDNMCSASNPERNNVGDNNTGDIKGWRNNKFAANYRLPGNFNTARTNVDPLTGYYKVYVTIALTGAVDGSSNQQEQGFRVSTTGAGAKLGMIADGSARNYSTVGVVHREGTKIPERYNTKQFFEFGVPCSAGAPVTDKVIIYDADSETFGGITFWVTERSASGGARQMLPLNRYRDLQRGVPRSVSGGVVFDSTAGSNQTSEIFIQDMKPGYEYSLVLQGNSPIASGNLIGVGLPRDSIYGDIPCDYELTPQIGFANSSLAPGASAPIVSTVTHSAPNVSSDPTQWRVTKFVYNNNQSIDALRANTSKYSQQDPCGAYSADNRDSCSATWSSSPNSNKTAQVFNTTTTSETFTYRATTAEIGKRVCFVTSVSFPKDAVRRVANETWRHSRMQCALIAKSPKVHIQGSDLRVDGDIRTSVTDDVDGKSFGSWVEYGVFSTGSNSTVSSGAGLKNGNGNDSTAKAAWSRLTFANQTDPYGTYDPLPTLSNARSYFGGLSATGPYNLSQSGVYDVGNVSISGNISGPGKSIIIRSSGTVTINGPITVNNSGLNKVADLSQVVILARNIIIADTVTNIDAWLLTQPGGSINTCSRPEPRLTTTICNAPLTINGAVMTDKLLLRRTHGAGDTDPGVAAEVLRLRPDALLWAYNYSNQTDRAQTVYLTELPPRF